MRIEPAIPIHVARAYGIPAANRAGPSPSPEWTSAAPEVAVSRPTEKIEQLLAGKVAGPVDFSNVSSPFAAGTFQMYNRAADKMEAAVAVQIGRTLDVRG